MGSEGSGHSAGVVSGILGALDEGKEAGCEGVEAEDFHERLTELLAHDTVENEVDGTVQ